MPMIRLPRLYAIIDSSCFLDADALFAAAQELEAGGSSLLQYRNKSGNARIMLEQGRQLRRRLGRGVKLIMNDRADVCLAAGFDGVHVGQDDLSPESVRGIVGPEFWLGISTHNPAQFESADATSADYIAVGPVFSTPSKDKPDPVVGLEGVRRARELTRKPLVAIGGITRENAASVIEAGAGSVGGGLGLFSEARQTTEEIFPLLLWK